MRKNFPADWAFGIKGAIESVVRTNFPEKLRLWPVVQNFNFEAYGVGNKHFVMVLRDKLSGIPSGPGTLKPFPGSNHPAIPPTLDNIVSWMDYLDTQFQLRPADIAMILPIYDCGKNDAGGDYQMFTVAEAQMWDLQLTTGIARQKTTVLAPVGPAPAQPASITYNINGTNSRVNINSSDSSVNIAETNSTMAFDELIEAIKTASTDSQRIDAMVASVEDMKRSVGTDSFIEKYTYFMGNLADHMQIFGVLSAPFLPAIAKFLS
ncbi:hypothetical protein [Pseudoxanthomonas sp. CF125]|uniref:hypothetical protein n=1 Tax=Pseudoxanthomonas sp. CF125 TaxID=1855303 RepID=UPI00087FB1B1|nr:hypothetical protein [Pseudoxanthomonas sp. CF125]SDQ84143.1 hypothetical protein SAMN05216569_2263 [Pseudoxanthomonas sp. CF125]